MGDRGSRVVKVLCYKSEGRWFDPDLIDFLRRSKWKMYQSPSRRRSVANFLTAVDHHMTVVTTMPEGKGPYNGRPHDVLPRPRKWTGG